MLAAAGDDELLCQVFYGTLLVVNNKFPYNVLLINRS